MARERFAAGGSLVTVGRREKEQAVVVCKPEQRHHSSTREGVGWLRRGVPEVPVRDALRQD
jgi:hypothetical protein